jgi:hypothetical protein
MEENKELINKDQMEEISIKKIIDGLTGFITSNKEDYAHTANRVLKSLFTNNFLFQLQMEWDYYCQKGKIDLDYQSSKPYMNSLAELLDYLDTDIPNDEIAETLKKLFFIPAFNDYYDDDKLLSIEYMKIIKNLNAGELMVLFTAYKNIGAIGSNSFWTASNWLKYIAERSLLKYPELVEVHEKRLMELHLLSDRLHSDRSGVSINDYFRLTNLGYNLCQYIERYDEVSKA